MRFLNETKFQAELVRVARGPAQTAAAVVVKATYDLCSPSLELATWQLPVLREPAELDGCDFGPDTILSKEGVDILIIGQAQAPGSSTRMMIVEASIEQASGQASSCWHRRAAVFGHRQWQRSRLRYTPSNPASFCSLPMTWTNAFGGIATSGGAPAPHPGNPTGRGYVLDLDRGLSDLRLPHIEDPLHLIERAGDAPTPRGFSPLPGTSALRVLPALDPGSVTGVGRSILNVAPPEHRLAALSGGERVSLAGWAKGGQGVFEVPLAPLCVEVTIDRRRYTFTPEIDTLLIAPTMGGTGRLVVTQRATFTYSYAAGVARVARLRSLAQRGVSRAA